MKRIIAILLIGILMFNWVGYQLYTAIMEQHADRALIANLDKNNYAESELISIKIPTVHLSFYVNSKGFERVDGQVELDGIQYNYVKRRYINDSLELLCIPNRKVTDLKTASDNFFKLVNDLQHPGQSKKADQHTPSFKCFNGEYYAQLNPFALPEPVPVPLMPTDRYLLQTASAPHNPANQPPDIA